MKSGALVVFGLLVFFIMLALWDKKVVRHNHINSNYEYYIKGQTDLENLMQLHVDSVITLDSVIHGIAIKRKLVKDGLY